MDTPADDTASPKAASPRPVAARHKGPAAPTRRERLEERLREVPDILDLLQSDDAKALVVPGEEDLWVTVRHFMTTTRAEAAVEFPAFLDKRIRGQLKLGEDDPIPAARLSEVQRLELTGMRLTDAGLAHLKGLARLESLYLNGTRVTDAGLAHLKELTGLRSLYLEGTRVTYAGRAGLKRALPECEIYGP